MTQNGIDQAADELAVRVQAAVAKAVGSEERLAVAFSGGLDSSVVAKCAAAEAQVIACTGSAEGTWDALRAQAAADSLGVDLVTTRLTPELVAAELTRVDFPSGGTLMDRSLWCLYSAVSRSAREAGARVILLGQLADELFGGYAKYTHALGERGPDAAKLMMEGDLKEYISRGRARDVKACSKWVEPRIPFEELADYAASIPISYKLMGGVRKAILRRAAVRLGVPAEIAEAPKKAAQYSSGIQKLVANAHF
ncbi:MAG: asparagine synthase [Nitrososphaerota archaeon]|jgi:asparagine synthase (glutamine-hydrolysing)|nr:asparagine synthase [Nitrososphaerota archaeon]MDG6942254.1 asparagine synthase [Nitrososphaerota archaeon]MDG6942719.1 asparagine synthase [Nitrososphaerota archaeon]MDG6948506.1 asparagine synthase [Nitrososphaerota archaeon]MDG6950432.1 asparagine synthase [Nitrososphaerota archaeon]